VRTTGVGSGPRSPSHGPDRRTSHEVHFGKPFDTDNPAWRRFCAIASEHFEAFCWEHDGQPVLVSLIDAASGTIITLAPVDSADATPTVLLQLDLDGSLSATGPLPGPWAADTVATRRVDAGAPVAATCPATLRLPAQPHIPPQVWIEVPEPIAEKMSAPPAPVDGKPPIVLVLLDRAGKRLVVIGPFDTAADAEAWQPEPHRIICMTSLSRMACHPTVTGRLAGIP
jgi:hypothetical protein